MAASWDWPDSLIVRIIDGDTVVAKVHRDMGFNGHAEFDVRLRLNRINAPPAKTGEGKRATELLDQTIGGLTVHLVTLRGYKYGGGEMPEWMAEITLPDGRNVSDMLVEAGLAAYWNGEGPRPLGATG